MKKLAIVALVLIVVGAAAFAIGFAANGFHIQLTYGDFHSESVTVEESFTDVRIDNGSYRVRVVPSEDGVCRADFDASEKITFTVEVKDGLLTVKQKDLRKWYEHIGWSNIGKRYLTLYLPERTYGNLTVESGSGSMELTTPYTFGEIGVEIGSGSFFAEGTTAEYLNLHISSGSGTISGVTVNGGLAATVSSGSMKLTGVRAETLFAKLSSGKLTLTDVIAAENAEIDIGSGSVILDGFDAAAIDIHVSSGGVKGTLLTAKNFDTHVSSGSIKVPPSDDSAGLCKIRVSSGSVNLSVKE